MHTALTLYPHRVSLSKIRCICHKISVQSQCLGASKLLTRGAKVSPQAEVVCAAEERLFSDINRLWHFTTGETEEEELWRKVGQQGQMLEPHLSSNWMFPKDGRHRNFQLPWQTASLGYAVIHHQDSFLRSSHYHLTYLSLLSKFLIRLTSSCSPFIISGLRSGFSVKLGCLQTLLESSSVALQNKWLKQAAFDRNPGKLMTTVPCPGEIQGWGGVLGWISSFLDAVTKSSLDVSPRDK